MLYNITPIAGLVTKILTFPKYCKCGGAIKLEYKTKIFTTILLCRYTAIFFFYYGIVGGRIGGWRIEGGADRVIRNASKDGLAAIHCL
jgi:hypothetical protein